MEGRTMTPHELLMFDFENGVPHYSTSEVCALCGISPQQLMVYVQHGVLKPEGKAPELWRFPPHALMQTRRAARLQRDLELEMPGLALTLELLEEVAGLRRENQRLQAQLACFVTPV
jgi:chaperone modulatory protein CbpM